MSSSVSIAGMDT